MNSFFIITNCLKKDTEREAFAIKKHLEAKGKVCYLQKKSENFGTSRFKYTDASFIPKDVECVIALGGDGTLLQASRDIVGTSLPLLGVNMGTLGYLAEIEYTNVCDALDRLIIDDFAIEDRMMLKGTVLYGEKKLCEDIALNDIVITRKGKLRVVDFNIYVDEVFLCSYRADGIIVSTPTGSTGYTLSEGGPIVSPDASLILLTAIAPHTLSSRTIILPDKVKVTVEAGSGHGIQEAGSEVTFDGDTSIDLDYGGRTVVSMADQKTHFIKINYTSFVENLREKLK